MDKKRLLSSFGGDSVRGISAKQRIENTSGRVGLLPATRPTLAPMRAFPSCCPPRVSVADAPPCLPRAVHSWAASQSRIEIAARIVSNRTICWICAPSSSRRCPMLPNAQNPCCVLNVMSWFPLAFTCMLSAAASLCLLLTPSVLAPQPHMPRTNIKLHQLPAGRNAERKPTLKSLREELSSVVQSGLPDPKSK